MEMSVIVTKKCHEIWWFQKKVVPLLLNLQRRL